MSRIHASKFLLRDEDFVEDLKISIDEKGLLHPVIVRIDVDGYEIVAGNRRFAACKQLGWRSIICHILELDDKSAFEVSLIENLQHRSLNPVQEALAYSKYIKEYGWGGVSELAKKIGKSHSYVSNRIRLLELPQDILDKIVCRQTSPNIAQELLVVGDKNKCREIVNEIMVNNLNRKEVRNLIHNDTTIDDHDFTSVKYALSPRERDFNAKEKIILRFITTLRIAMMRLDDAINSVDEKHWILAQDLIYHRTMLHKQIDDLLILRKKMRLSHIRY